ncbi:MAG: hypothetical protein ACKVP7_17780 [Hyphomicrobiaceae bacterium]
MKRGFVVRDDTAHPHSGNWDGGGAIPWEHGEDDRECADAALGQTIAPTNLDRLHYMADLLAEFQAMAMDMQLGKLARILSVAVAETDRLAKTTPAQPASGGGEQGAA